PDAGRTVTPGSRITERGPVRRFRICGEQAEIRPVPHLGREEAALVGDAAERGRSEAVLAGRGGKLQKSQGNARRAVRVAGQRPPARPRPIPTQAVRRGPGAGQQVVAAPHGGVPDRRGGGAAFKTEQPGDTARGAEADVEVPVLLDQL